MINHLSVLILSTMVIYTDARHGKIYNWMTYPGIGLGLVSNVTLFGMDGLKSSLAGLGVAFFLTIPFLIAGGMGGGDVKLLMAIGALEGFLFLLSTLFYSAILGGIWVMGRLIWKGRFLSALVNIMKFTASVFYPPWRTSLQANEHTDYILFGIPIALGCYWTLIEIALQKSLLGTIIMGGAFF